jgi:hypothetical protein
MHWLLKNLSFICKVELLQILNILRLACFICFSFFDFAKVTQKKNCGKMHAFDSQKKTQISSYSPFFSQNIRKFATKKKASIVQHFISHSQEQHNNP